jgi:ATP-dependent DNA helicase RecQ
MADPTPPDLPAAVQDLEQSLRRFAHALETPRTVSKRTARAGTETPATPGSPLFEALRRWRSEQARERRMPPYIIATDAVLRAIAESRPATQEALAAVRGVGPSRAAQHGAAILRIVAEYTQDPVSPPA